MGQNGMGQNGHGPIWLWAEMTSDRYQNYFWWHIQMTIIHQDLWSGKLVPSP